MAKQAKGLGRIHIPDERDFNFPMKAVLPSKSPIKTYKYWNHNGAWLDQKSSSSCVGHAWAHFVEDAPITYPDKTTKLDPYLIYNEARKVDQWVGELYDGTSVRAGAKVLQSMGFIESYHWAFSLDSVVQAILLKSPVVVGTTWYEGMSNPDKDNVLRLTGREQGGHAYVLNGVNTKTAMFRMKNSWDRNNWGKKGYAYISFEDFDKLLKDYGEACLAVECRKD